jgi:hypothetical protein
MGAMRKYKTVNAGVLKSVARECCAAESSGVWAALLD